MRIRGGVCAAVFAWAAATGGCMSSTDLLRDLTSKQRGHPDDRVSSHTALQTIE